MSVAETADSFNDDSYALGKGSLPFAFNRKFQECYKDASSYEKLFSMFCVTNVYQISVSQLWR